MSGRTSMSEKTPAPTTSTPAWGTFPSDRPARQSEPCWTARYAGQRDSRTVHASGSGCVTFIYDAVSAKDSVKLLMGEGKLADIARDLVKAVRNNLSTDWTARDDVQAKLRSIIKRLLAEHGYPPEEEKDAIDKVIRQLETFADEWAPRSDA